MPAEAPAHRVRRRPPETEAQRTKRLEALAIQLADREHRAESALAALSGARPRRRPNVRPLELIEDEGRRLEVWRARVERLEALLDQTARKRETRAKIVLGASLLAEVQDGGDDPLLSRVVEILDRRVLRPRDRLALAETLGLPLAPRASSGPPELPDFEALLSAQASGGRQRVD